MQRFRKGGPAVGKVSDGILIIKNGVVPDYPHTFLSVLPCDEFGTVPEPGADGSYASAGISGQVSVKVITENAPNLPQAVPDSIDLAKPSDISWDGNTTAIVIDPSNTAGSEYYVVRWTHNIS